jgi:hypothetical protein
MNKYYILGLVVVLLVAIGAYAYPVAKAPALGTSATGSSFGNATKAVPVIALANPGANGTTTSYLNSSPNDYYITNQEASCEKLGTSQTAYTGTGLAALTFTIATSSTANPATNSNPNTLPVITVATTTGNFVISSSTAGTPGVTNVSNIWAAGSYLTVTANATNTATCSVGVSYTSS